MAPCGKVIAAFLLLFFAGSCASWEIFRDPEKEYGKEPPSFVKSFASPTIRPGETWKVYLQGIDPNGDMQSIVAEIHQPGQGTYPVSYTRLKPENAREFSGYVYLNTMTPSGFTWQEFLTLSLTVQIRDKAGHFSAPLTFPLAFSGRFTQEEPPAGVFPEKSLGPVMITLRHYSNDEGGFD